MSHMRLSMDVHRNVKANPEEVADAHQKDLET